MMRWTVVLPPRLRKTGAKTAGQARCPPGHARLLFNDGACRYNVIVGTQYAFAIGKGYSGPYLNRSCDVLQHPANEWPSSNRR